MIKRIISFMLILMLVIAMPTSVFAEEADNEIIDEELSDSSKMIEPKVPATNYPLKYIYPDYIQKRADTESNNTESLGNSGECGIGILKRSYIAKGKYTQKEGLKFGIVYEGYTSSGLRVKADGATFTGLETNHLLTDSSTGAVYKFRENYQTSTIDPDISQLTIEISCTPVQTNNNNTIRRYIVVNFDDGRGEAPKDLSFKITGEADSERYILENADSTMEYRLKSGTEWTSCSDETFFDIPTKATSYYVRYKATEDSIESQVTELSLKPLPSAPSVSYGTTTEAFTGLTTDMEIAVDDGEYTPVTEEIIQNGVTPYIDALTDSSAVLKIRKAKTEETAAGKVKELTIYPRRELTLTPVLNENTYIMTGINSSVQYRIEGYNWSTVSSSTKQLSFLNYAKEDTDTYVDIRMKATDTASASKSQRYTIKQLLKAPNYLTLNYEKATIDGFESDKTYQIKKPGGTSWINPSIVDGSLDISSYLSVSKAVTVQVREKGTDTTGYSATLQVECKEKPDVPADLSITYSSTDSIKTAHLNGVDESMEYKLGTNGELKRAGNEKEILDIPASKTTVYVRYAGTESEFPSSFTSVSLKTNGSAPSITYNSTTEILSGLKDSMEYAVGEGDYIKVEGITTMDCKDIIDSLKNGESIDIKIRTAETETSPVSKETVKTMYGRADMPTGLTFDTETNKLSGISTKMQYREKGTTAWKSISKGTTVTLTSLINGRTDVQLEVRYKATTTAAASDIVVINLY